MCETGNGHWVLSLGSIITTILTFLFDININFNSSNTIYHLGTFQDGWDICDSWIDAKNEVLRMDRIKVHTCSMQLVSTIGAEVTWRLGKGLRFTIE